MTAASPTAQRWIYGPLPDLVLGCGGIYLLLLLVLPGLSEVSALAAWQPFAVALLGLLTNIPHYGATLLRVYERSRDRRRYLLFSVYLTAVLWALFVLGLHALWLGSVLVTLYITWSPWHFAGQNYGLALMFLRRRGVDVPPLTKRLLYASFVCSYGLTFLSMHGPAHSLGVAPVPSFGREVFDFLSIGLPAGPARVGFVACGIGYVASLLGAGILLLRRAGSVRDLGPSVLLIATQAVWFSVPAWLQLSGGVGGGRLFVATTWIAIAHSLQYLWISSYYARRAGEQAPLPRYLGKTLLAGAAITGLPALLFAPQVLGPLSYQAGLAILLFSVVNLHHFMLDGVIWRLRDGPVARVLLRSAAEPAEGSERDADARGWLRGAVWAAAAAALCVEVFGIWEMEFGVRRPLERGDVVRAERANQALAWIGRESHAVEQNIAVQLARRFEANGATAEQWDEVRRHYQRSLVIQPSAAAWFGLGTVDRKLGDAQGALRCYEHALALDPRDVESLRLAGETWLDLGRADLARPALERARELAPDDPGVRRALLRLARAEPGGSAAASELGLGDGHATGRASAP